MTIKFHVIIFSLLFPFTTPLPHHRHPPLSPPFTRHPSSLPHAPPPPPPPPIQFFEVRHPVNHPPTTPCSHLILQHDFSYTYGKPPVTVPYAPPSHCPFSTYSSVTLHLSAACHGRQFDRIFGVWLGGVELLRSCTAEPTRDGITWNVFKDISKYTNLLTKKNNTLSVYIGNLVDKTYTGVYHVNLTLHYYPPVVEKSSEIYPDLVLPVSRELPLNDGLWFEVEGAGVVLSKGVVIPNNVYRAVLEVYVSPHENDEFWYGNMYNDYLIANNLTAPGNGPFREVLVSLDGDLIGGVWPFTVVYTGGVNPLLWRPITAIGSFDLPSYDIEVTPFLGRLLDGKSHEFGFSVTNALNVWYIDGNLHLWLDDKSKETKGGLLVNNVDPLAFSSRSEFNQLNGRFYTSVNRSISNVGWVLSSHGNITTTSTQSFSYENSMVLEKDGNLQGVNQEIGFNSSVSAGKSLSDSEKKFSVFLYTDEVDQGDGSYSLITNVTLGFNENKTVANGPEILSTSLENKQKGDGIMVVKNNLVSRGLGSTHQVYKYEESVGICYFRDVRSSNYTILHDHVEDECNSDSAYHDGFRWAKHSIE